MNISNFDSPKERKMFANPKIGFVFIGLIVLQFSLLPFIPNQFASQDGLNRYVDYIYLYVVCSYSIIVFGILIFQAHGVRILSDHITLGLIALSCLVRGTLGGSHEQFYLLYLSFLGVVLLIYIVAKRKTIELPDSKLIIVGLLWSIGTLILIVFVHALLDSSRLISIPQNPVNYLIRSFFFQFSFGIVIEEICFRGLIFGFLVMNGYKEDSAFIIQAFLFWGIHYARISSPILFFISIPLLTLSTTLIVRKYKAVYLSIMVHTIANVFAPILAGVVNRWLF